MGNEQSNLRTSHDMMYDSFMYAPTTTHRTQAEHQQRFIQDDAPRLITAKSQAPLLKTAYKGIWSMEFSTTIGPIVRIGQCQVYDPELNRIIIAYGCSSNGRFLNDMWAYNMHSSEWHCISKSLLSPRQYPSAVLIGRDMYVFGGACENEFFADFHRINIDTGACQLISTHGTQPCPRTSPALFSYHNSIFLWSGYDGRSHGGVYKIDLDHPNPTWYRFPNSHTGLPAPAFCQYKDQYFVFGGVNGSPLSEFDPKTGDFNPFPCIGTEPSIDLIRPSLVAVDEFIFLIGGDASIEYMHIFALDIKRKWWFAFHVRPDNVSLSLSDGLVNKIGLFMLPREHSSSVVYSPQLRTIVSVMGSRMIDPPPIFKIEIGEALASVHLRSDMFEMIQPKQD